MRKFLPMIACVAALAAGSVAYADPVSGFYAGKTVTIIVGSSPGGGYDAAARTVGHHIGRLIPGKPNVIIQNMPGARGLTAANNLFNLSKRDGTVIGVLERMHLIDAYLIPDGVRYDERLFNWIGSTGTEIGVALAWHTSSVKKIDDLRQRELVIGGDSSSVTMPRVYNATLRTKFKIITGYPGSASVIMAMEKQELDGIGDFGLSNLVAKYPKWIDDKKINVLIQNGKLRDVNFPDVPTALELALNEEKRQILEIWLTPNDIARPFAMPPDVPSERVMAVRQAFMDLFKDTQFLEDAKKGGMVIDPRDGKTIDQTIQRLRSMPAHIIAAARAAGEE